jgi:3-keto-5-aminohexanoate cleavage enzyme
MARPLIITVAGVGAELTRDMTPYVPLTPDEIAAEAAKVQSLGARVFHLHVRDNQGRPTCDPHVIRTVIRKIRKAAPGMILQISTGGSVTDTAEDRIGTLVQGIEMASLTEQW